MNEIIRTNEPVSFQARNPYPRYSRLKDGDCFKITIEVSEEDWQRLRTMPPNAILEVMLWHHDGDGKTVAELTEKPTKGPHSAYWRAMFTSGFHLSTDLREVLGVEKAEQVKDALHKYFDVDSLSHVSPAQFEEWVDHNYLTMMVTLSRQATAKAGAVI